MRFMELRQEMPSAKACNLQMYQCSNAFVHCRLHFYITLYQCNLPGLVIYALTRLQDNLFAVRKLPRSLSMEKYICVTI